MGYDEWQNKQHYRQGRAVGVLIGMIAMLFVAVLFVAAQAWL